MSEAYTSQPQNMGLPAIHSSQFDLRHDVMPLPSLPSLASSMNKRKRSPSLSKNPTPSKVSKKSSTPNIKSNNEDAASSDSDKKRNKLGYHRTSVACGHCRRRKIRCMMPDDDPSGRCSNCIRLKKECIFCPVEQSGAGKAPQNSRAGSAPKPSMRSSPSMYYGNSYDFCSGIPYSSGHTSYSVPPPDTATGLNLSGVNFPTSEPPVPYGTQSYDIPSTTWESSSYATLPPISAPFESPLSISPVNHTYTRSPSVRPSYPDSTYGSASTTNNGKAPISNEIGWTPQHSQPQRSMSLQVDSASSYRNQSPYRQSHSPQPLQAEHGRRSASIPQPASLVMSSDSSTTPSLSEPTSIGSMSAPVGSTYWNNPWTPIPGGPNDFEGKPIPPVESLDWFPETMNAYESAVHHA